MAAEMQQRLSAVRSGKRPLAVGDATTAVAGVRSDRSLPQLAVDRSVEAEVECSREVRR